MPPKFFNTIEELQFYIDEYASHHDLFDVPYLSRDGKRGPLTIYATRLTMYYQGFDGADWRNSSRYNNVSDQQRIRWLRNPSTRNVAMKAKSLYRIANKGTGSLIWSPTANRPGVGVHHQVIETLNRMAALCHEPLYIQTGTNHCEFVNCDPTANVSDHWNGNAADVRPKTYGGSDGDLICAAALRTAGVGEGLAWAQARNGGEFVYVHGANRFDILWKTLIGGDHYQHIHVGVRPV